jgi:hypothetical protein
LGEVLLFGRLYTLASFYITEVAQIFGLIFSVKKNYGLILVKNELGQTLGEFFASSSGRPAAVLCTQPFLHENIFRRHVFFRRIFFFKF